MADQTYQQLGDLMNDINFRSRVKVACLHFANYIIGEDVSVPAHSTRLRWAQATMAQPDTAAFNVTPPLCMDANVVAQGAAISDSDLQSSVETTVNKMI